MHDPLTALGEPLPTPTPWESLARQARWLADLADQYAKLEPEQLAPDGDIDPLADLDARALAVRSVVAACRHATWQALKDDGHTYAEIGTLWGVTRGAVSAKLTAPDRKR